MNKKILAILMALLMVLMSSVAFAADEVDDSFKNDTGANNFKIVKTYTTDAENDFVPAETLAFTATFDEFEATDAADAEEPAAADIPSFSGSEPSKEGTYNVTISGDKAFPKAGKYYYTLTETTSNVQGVEYGTEEIKFVVTVGYNESGALVILDVGVVKANGKKEGTITNDYTVGEVIIDKVVTGNAADLTDEFAATVTITAAADKQLPENFTIYYTDCKETKKEVALTKDSASFSVVLKDATNVVIENLPEGALVTVEETDTSLVNLDGNDDPTKYDVEYSDNNGTAAASANAPTITVTNDRVTTIDTGVDTDSMPYIMLMAFVMMLAAAVVLKKRTVND